MVLGKEEVGVWICAEKKHREFLYPGRAGSESVRSTWNCHVPLGTLGSFRGQWS
jgi:hypothetical protein